MTTKLYYSLTGCITGKFLPQDLPHFLAGPNKLTLKPTGDINQLTTFLQSKHMQCVAQNRDSQLRAGIIIGLRLSVHWSCLVWSVLREPKWFLGSYILYIHSITFNVLISAKHSHPQLDDKQRTPNLGYDALLSHSKTYSVGNRPSLVLVPFSINDAPGTQ